MRCRVAHTSAIDSVKPGAVGDFDEGSHGVRLLLKAGHLVPVEGAEAPRPTDLPVALDTTDLDALRARFDARITELETEGADRDLRITELEVENAQLKLDLEAATAPKASV